MKKRILIIGDMEVSLKILAQKLCLEDYDIRTPPDGKTAISFLFAEPPLRQYDGNEQLGQA